MTEKTTSTNPLDIFIVGVRKGINIALLNLTPNVLMAFVFAHMLTLLGVMDFLGQHCGPFMALFGLPGQAITVLLAAWLSASAGAGMAASSGQPVLSWQQGDQGEPEAAPRAL